MRHLASMNIKTILSLRLEHDVNANLIFSSIGSSSKKTLRTCVIFNINKHHKCMVYYEALPV